MPKETIYDRVTPYHSLSVGWTRGGVTGITAQVGGDIYTGEPYPPIDVHLDRDGINRLIRTLRKARDQAYGSDA